MKEVEKSIESTRNSFENSFSENNFYNKQTQDGEHLNSIINTLDLKKGEKVLDLGTGSGYIAFEIAKSYPEVTVTGLDIVTKTLEENKKKAEKAGFKNIEFISYDGIHFPFEGETFDVIVTRYALHHFPDISGTFDEISRVLKMEGRILISDPTPNDNDSEGFVDDYMQMKKDGHIKFYSEEEFKNFGASAGLRMMSNNKTSIRFPKKRVDAAEIDSIVAKHSKKIVDGYELLVTDEEIYITEQVNNILFTKPDINGIKNKLVSDVFSLKNVLAIAQTGSIDKVTRLNETDIDIFVLCDEIPSKEARQQVYDKSKSNFDNCYMTVCENCEWGTGDIMVNSGVDIMFMYFTVDEMRNFLLEILSGKHLNKQGGFYPVGRLGSIQMINILCEKNNTFTDIKKLVENYPEDFAQKNFAHNFYNIIQEEELQRTVQRLDVLFYHSVLEDAIDHFLQALFALNHTYFPSRKRSRQYIDKFEKKPIDCYLRLKQIVFKSVSEDTIVESVNELRKLTDELRQLGTIYLS